MPVTCWDWKVFILCVWTQGWHHWVRMQFWILKVVERAIDMGQANESDSFIEVKQENIWTKEILKCTTRQTTKIYDCKEFKKRTPTCLIELLLQIGLFISFKLFCFGFLLNFLFFVLIVYCCISIASITSNHDARIVAGVQILVKIQILCIFPSTVIIDIIVDAQTTDTLTPRLCLHTGQLFNQTFVSGTGTNMLCS